MAVSVRGTVPFVCYLEAFARAYDFSCGFSLRLERANPPGGSGASRATSVAAVSRTKFIPAAVRSVTVRAYVLRPGPAAPRG